MGRILKESYPSFFYLKKNKKTIIYIGVESV
nr:MAG TPA: hypothetical protein [Caudoviricetes sp.]